MRSLVAAQGGKEGREQPPVPPLPLPSLTPETILPMPLLVSKAPAVSSTSSTSPSSSSVSSDSTSANGANESVFEAGQNSSSRDSASARNVTGNTPEESLSKEEKKLLRKRQKDAERQRRCRARKRAAKHAAMKGTVLNYLL